MSNRIGTAVTNAATIMPEWVTGLNFFKARFAGQGLAASASQSVAIMKMPGGSRLTDCVLQVTNDHEGTVAEHAIAQVWDSLNGITRQYIRSATVLGEASDAEFKRMTVRANRVENLGQRITGSANLIVSFSPGTVSVSASLTVDLAVWYTRDIERSST